MRDRVGMLCQVYKIVVGIIGVSVTVMAFIWMLVQGGSAAITLDGTVVMGTIGTLAVLAGNGYAMWRMAESGFRDL